MTLMRRLDTPPRPRPNVRAWCALAQPNVSLTDLVLMPVDDECSLAAIVTGVPSVKTVVVMIPQAIIT